jgi:hypothetical protein
MSGVADLTDRLMAVCPLLIIWVLPTAVSPLTMMVVLPLMESLSISCGGCVRDDLGTLSGG